MNSRSIERPIDVNSVHFKHHHVLLFAQRPLVEEESNPPGERILDHVREEDKLAKGQRKKMKVRVVVVGTDSLSKRVVKVRESSNMAFHVELL